VPKSRIQNTTKGNSIKKIKMQPQSYYNSKSSHTQPKHPSNNQHAKAIDLVAEFVIVSARSEIYAGNTAGHFQSSDCKVGPIYVAAPNSN
jgi:hypothetical protein